MDQTLRDDSKKTIDPEILHLPQNNVVVSNSMARKEWIPNSIYEGRIFTYIASLIKSTDKVFRTYEIPISEILEQAKVTCSGTTYKLIKKAITDLASRTVTIEEDRKIEVYSVFAKCSYDDSIKKIEVCFNDLLNPHFLSLTKNFTKYPVNIFMLLPSIPTQTLYVYLRSYKNTHKSIDVEISELHKKLNSPKTQINNFAEFKRRVLIDARDNINEVADYNFDFQEIKRKNKVLAVRFIFTNVQKDEIAIPESPFTKPSVADIERNKISAQASRCLARHSGDNTKCQDTDNDICRRCLSLRSNN